MSSYLRPPPNGTLGGVLLFRSIDLVGSNDTTIYGSLFVFNVEQPRLNKVCNRSLNLNQLRRLYNCTLEARHINRNSEAMSAILAEECELVAAWFDALTEGERVAIFYGLRTSISAFVAIT